jgi:hypothetical protein
MAVLRAAIFYCPIFFLITKIRFSKKEHRHHYKITSKHLIIAQEILLRSFIHWRQNE